MTPAIMKWKDRYDHAMKATKRLREKTGETVEAVLGTVVSGGTAGAIGILAGRYGEEALKVGGVPLTVAGGLAGNLLALMGVGGKAEPYLRAAANGAVDSWTTMEGLKLGAKMRLQAESNRSLPPAQSTKGEDPVADLLSVPVED